MFRKTCTFLCLMGLVLVCGAACNMPKVHADNKIFTTQVPAMTPNGVLSQCPVPTFGVPLDVTPPPVATVLVYTGTWAAGNTPSVPANVFYFDDTAYTAESLNGWLPQTVVLGGSPGRYSRLGTLKVEGSELFLVNRFNVISQGPAGVLVNLQGEQKTNDLAHTTPEDVRVCLYRGEDF